FAVLRYVSRAAKITGSPALNSDARHLWTMVVQGGAIIVGLALVLVTGEKVFDAITGLALAAYLFYTAFRILLDSANDILDRSLHEEDYAFVEAAIRAHGDEIAG